MADWLTTLPAPQGGVTLEMADRVRALLGAEADLMAFVTGGVRDFPPTQVSAEDGLIAALFVPDFDFTTETLETNRRNPRLILQLMGYDIAGKEAQVYRRLWDVTDAFVLKLWQWRAGPGVNSRTWHSLRFGSNPAVQWTRKAGAYQTIAVQIYLKSQRNNP